jgi:hypothetical protein
VKRSGSDEAIRVVIHLCMEAMLGMFPYRYTYLNYQKCVVFLLLILCLIFNKIGEKGRTGSSWKCRSEGRVGRGRGKK